MLDPHPVIIDRMMAKRMLIGVEHEIYAPVTDTVGPYQKARDARAARDG